ncbi:MAG: zinc ribbon domain-containing protein [Thermoplasmata archaeon]|nr:zinc ribbon domain-containing protein [Thermoplasmata archaeon]
MKCPNCGHEVGESPFCPNCGADLTSTVRRRRRFLRNIDRGVRKGTAAAVILVAVMSVLAVVLTSFPLGDSGSSSGSDIPEDAIVLDSGAYIVLSDGFGEDGVFTASLDASGQLVIVLSQDLAEGYSTFRWDFRDDVRAVSSVITKDDSQLTWMEPSIGKWSVTVYCSGYGSETAVYTGYFECWGDSTTTYRWTHSGVSMSFSYTVSLSQYRSSVNGTDWDEDTLAAAVAAVDSGSVAADLESRVWQAYSSAFSDASRTSADYAACIMEFVDTCFTEQSDLVTYGESVYWASPAETAYAGIGDQADLTVLAVSMLKAAGFDAGIVKYPDGWAVAVSADPSDSSALYTRVSGTFYWICSATDFDGIGSMPDRYGRYGLSLTYCGSLLPTGCGISIC